VKDYMTASVRCKWAYVVGGGQLRPRERNHGLMSFNRVGIT
jgi:hypothetical protein